MTETQKLTREQADALEVAPGFSHENLEGWVPALATEEALREALEKAFDFRGDITITLKSGERLEAYVFNRHTAGTLAESWVQYFVPNAPEKRKTPYDQIAALEFTGKDRAAGKHWEDWVKKYSEKKAAGEHNIRLDPDALD